MVSFKILLHPQFRVFSIPWVKKSSIICLKSRDYGSSGPVRYIPKKSSKINKLENAQPPKGSKNNEDCKFSDTNALRNEIRYGGSGEEKNINFGTKLQYKRPAEKGQIDHDLGAVGYEFIEEPEPVVEELGIQQNKKFIEEPEQVIEELGVHQNKHRVQSEYKYDAEKLAIKLLAARALTVVELRKKLHGKRFDQDTVESVIIDFQSRLYYIELEQLSGRSNIHRKQKSDGSQGAGYIIRSMRMIGLINDGLYAEAFCRSRWSSSSWGPRRIKQALYQKGVSEVEAEKAIKLVFQNEECGGDDELSHGLSKLSMDHLFVQASKQWLRGKDTPKETRKTRIIRWLQYRGFHWDVISFILKKLESEYPP